MLIYGYYNLSKGTIIFVRPNINNTLFNQLNEAIKFLYEVFKVFGFQFNFKLYVNDEFNIHIDTPLSMQLKHHKRISKLKVEKTSATVSSRLTEYLETAGLETIDKRPKGGALWVLGGEELEPFINDLSTTENITFKFAIKGSMSTKNMPAWYTNTIK